MRWPCVAGEGTAQLIYDGECPVCSYFARTLRLRETVGELRIIDARRDASARRAAEELGFDLDEGVVLRIGGSYFHGADALHAIALLSSPVGVFNRCNHAVFRSPRLARWLYPGLRGARNLLLRLLGKEKIHREGESAAGED